MRKRVFYHILWTVPRLIWFWIFHPLFQSREMIPTLVTDSFLILFCTFIGNLTHLQNFITDDLKTDCNIQKHNVSLLISCYLPSLKTSAALAKRIVGQNVRVRLLATRWSLAFPARAFSKAWAAPPAHFLSHFIRNFLLSELLRKK